MRASAAPKDRPFAFRICPECQKPLVGVHVLKRRHDHCARQAKHQKVAKNRRPPLRSQGTWQTEHRAPIRKPPIMDPRFAAIFAQARAELDRQTVGIKNIHVGSEADE